MAVPSTWHEEDGFQYRLFSAKTEKPTSLILYLHGLDGNAEISDAFIDHLHQKIPGADVIALQAPIKIRQSNTFREPKGYSWFPFTMSIKSEVKTWFNHIFKRLTIAEKVEAFTKSQLEKRGLAEDKMAYYGHSMGGIVALQAGLSGDKPVAAIVSDGGAVMPVTKVKNNSKVFLQMGQFDELFNKPTPSQPPQKGFLQQIFTRSAENIGLALNHDRSVQRLKSQNVPLTEKVYPQQRHMQYYTSWKDGVEFIAKAFAAKP